jgi:hypothetical protein
LRTEQETRKVRDSMLAAIRHLAAQRKGELTEDEYVVTQKSMWLIEALEWTLGESNTVDRAVEMWKKLEALMATFEAEHLRLLDEFGIQILPTGGIQ